MLNIIYAKEGQAISDFDCANFISEHIGRDDHTITVSTENVILRIRAMVVEKRVSHLDFKFTHFDSGLPHHISCDSEGQINASPEGFCDFCRCNFDILIGALYK